MPKPPAPMDGQMQMVAVHPRTGEAIDLHSAATDELLDCHDAFVDLKREMAEGQREIDDELVRRMDHEGRRSFTFSDFKVEVTPPIEKAWDIGKLQVTLSQLIEEGLISIAKADRCVRHKPEVAWAEVKTLLSDPRVKDRIEECFEEVPARRQLRVSRRRR